MLCISGCLGVDKIVGFAVSHHARSANFDTSTLSESKLVLSSERFAEFSLFVLLVQLNLVTYKLIGYWLKYCSIQHGLSMLQNIQSDSKGTKKSLKVAFLLYIQYAGMILYQILIWSSLARFCHVCIISCAL